MSETQTQTITEINEATEASLAARATESAKAAARNPSPAKRAAKKAAPKAEPKPAAKAEPKVRKAMTPKERAAKPVTSTIADYVAWLEKNVTGKLTADQKHLAGLSITLYGSYQASPERRAARSA
jgi:hypothetical protein